jgi:phage gp29-like protein
MAKKTARPAAVLPPASPEVVDALRALLESPELRQTLLSSRAQVAAPQSSSPRALQRPKAGSTVPGASSGSGKSREALPPSEGAPRATFPIAVAQQEDNAQLSPPPLVDRYPTVVGSQLSFSYIATVARLCTTGYRQQAVDLWRELLEQDLHLASVLQKRILSVSNGKFEILPADLEEDDPDYDLAEQCAVMVRKEVSRIPDFTTSLATLLWAIYYAVQAAEIIWTKDSYGWHVERLEFVHSRRIAWPDMQSWDAYIWDQGQVFGWNSPWGSTPTNAGVFGLRLADWPGKYIFFAPQLFADYPTREGLARQCAMWAAFKRVPVRGAIDYLERFAKGFLDISFTTQASQEPRMATDQDIDFASALANVLGPGNGRTAVHPNSLTIEPKSFEGGGGKAKLTWKEWLEICNAEISKVVLGGTLGTEVSSGGGNRALGEVQERAETDLEQFDATALAECLRRDLVTTLVRLNMPEALHVVPRVLIHIEAEPDAKSVVANAIQLADRGVPLDADDVAQKSGLKCVPNESKDEKGDVKPRRMFKSDFIDPSLVDSTLLSDEAKQAAQDDKDAANELALQKARQPGVSPIGAPGGGQAPANANGKTPPPKGKAPVKAPQARAGKVKPAASAKGSTKKLSEDSLTFMLTARSSVLKLADYAGRTDRDIVREVYEMLLDDYPPSSLDWVLAAKWRGPVEVPMADIDFSRRSTWRASHEDLSSYVGKLREGLAGDKTRKPGIFVETPSNPLDQIVDGHHRTLSAEALGVPAWAYVATVYVDNGPWERMHAMQKKGSSKESVSKDDSFIYEEEAETHDDEAAE